ncbi:MAG: pilus assembly protein N-terminal domain-containing protein [Acidobacteriaceae bacterium]
MKIATPIRGNFSRLLLGAALLLPLHSIASRSADAETGHAPTIPQPSPVSVPFSSGVVSGDVVQADSMASNLHLVVGRSIFFKTTARLHRIYISDPTVLQSFTSSPNQVIITARSPGVSSLAIWDAAGHSTLYTVSADVDVEALRRSIQQALPGEAVRVRAKEGRVYLSGTVRGDGAEKEAVKLASIYSKDVVDSLSVTYVHPQQVQLKVRIAEIDRTKLAQFGFNFFSGGANTSSVSTQQFSSLSTQNSSTGGTGTTTLQVSNPLNFFIYNSKLNIGATVADLESHNILQILAEPTITTVSGHEADFLSGGEFPYPVIQGGGGTFASVTIMFQPYGVKLKFTPTVNADGTILLKVAPEVSALDYSNAVTISGYTIPAISTRRAETEVELRDGESFSISGLLNHQTTVLLSKVPGIGNVPILGELFKSKNNTRSVVELVVIVTATVVDPLHHATHPVTPKMSIPNLSTSAFDSTNPKTSRQ